MKLIRCPKGHFYDVEKYQTCPHCEGEAGQSADDDLTVPLPRNGQDDVPTSKKNASGQEEIFKTESISSRTEKSELAAQLNQTKSLSDADDAKTIGMFKKTYAKDTGCDPVVGWLVCTVGSHYGEDFKLRAGRNFIGRSEKMDICLKNDATISREKHMVILYEPKANIFMVQPGDSRELSYLNENVILEAKQINPYDVIILGETQLTFVPFCSDSFKWKEAAKEEKSDKE